MLPGLGTEMEGTTNKNFCDPLYVLQYIRLNFFSITKQYFWTRKADC